MNFSPYSHRPESTSSDEMGKHYQRIAALGDLLPERGNGSKTFQRSYGFEKDKQLFTRDQYIW